MTGCQPETPSTLISVRAYRAPLDHRARSLYPARRRSRYREGVRRGSHCQVPIPPVHLLVIIYLPVIRTPVHLSSCDLCLVGVVRCLLCLHAIRLFPHYAVLVAVVVGGGVTYPVCTTIRRCVGYGDWCPVPRHLPTPNNCHNHHMCWYHRTIADRCRE